MSEEITYANLKFQDSSRTENTQDLHKSGEKAPPAAFRLWRQTVLTLTLLCLLLLIGLGVLGSIFYKTLTLERGKLNKLQDIKEELQTNVSLQLTNNIKSSAEIRSLSITLQKLATELCRELSRKKPDHKCKPCPKSWIWYEDSCYVISDNFATWQNSEILCSSKNASLLKVKSKRVSEFIKSLNLYNYWLGLSPIKQYINNENLDEIITSSNWFKRNTSDLNNAFCGYIHGSTVYYINCSYTKKIICEKMATLVKMKSILSSEVPDGRM